MKRSVKLLWILILSYFLVQGGFIILTASCDKVYIVIDDSVLKF